MVSNFLGPRLLKLRTFKSLRSVNSGVSDAVQSQQVDKRPRRKPGSAAGLGVLLNIAGLCLHLPLFPTWTKEIPRWRPPSRAEEEPILSARSRS